MTHSPMTSPVQAAARVLTGSTYVMLGYGALHKPGPVVAESAPFMAAIRSKVPLPVADEQLVQVNGTPMAASGVLLALGRVPRATAFFLAGAMIPTTLAAHSFWTVKDPAVRKRQQIQFHKNIAMIGGLLFAALDSPPADS